MDIPRESGSVGVEYVHVAGVNLEADRLAGSHTVKSTERSCQALARLQDAVNDRFGAQHLACLDASP
jgi:hypothetical protein